MADQTVTCDCGFLKDRLFWRRIMTPADIEKKAERLKKQLNAACPKCNGVRPEYAKTDAAFSVVETEESSPDEDQES